MSGALRLSPQTIGGLAAALMFGLDQFDKAWTQHVLFVRQPPPVAVGPYLDLIMAWNPGISYSLFSATTPMGRYLLLGVTLLATLALAWWLWRARTRLLSLGLGLLIGGALGNALDRFRFGAVADFFAFHVGSFSWYVFNLADCGIVVGVAILLYDNLYPPPNLAVK